MSRYNIDGSQLRYIITVMHSVVWAGSLTGSAVVNVSDPLHVDTSKVVLVTWMVTSDCQLVPTTHRYSSVYWCHVGAANHCTDNSHVSSFHFCSCIVVVKFLVLYILIKVILIQQTILRRSGLRHTILMAVIYMTPWPPRILRGSVTYGTDCFRWQVSPNRSHMLLVHDTI